MCVLGGKNTSSQKVMWVGFPREGSWAEGGGGERWQLFYSALHLALENAIHLPRVLLVAHLRCRWYLSPWGQCGKGEEQGQ